MVIFCGTKVYKHNRARVIHISSQQYVGKSCSRCHTLCACLLSSFGPLAARLRHLPCDWLIQAAQFSGPYIHMSNNFTTNSWKKGTTIANPGFNLFHAHSKILTTKCADVETPPIFIVMHILTKEEKEEEKNRLWNKKNSDVFAVDVVEGAITQSWKDRPSHVGSGMTTHNPPPRHQQKERHQKVLLQSLDWNTVARNCDDVPTAPYFHHSKSRIHKLGCHMYT